MMPAGGQAGTELLARIEDYCQRTGTHEGRIGTILFRHPGFVGLLRKRGSLTELKRRSVELLIERHPDGLPDGALTPELRQTLVAIEAGGMQDGLAVAAALLAECEAFLTEHPMPPSTFGKLACGQTMLLESLRNAKAGPQERTVQRVRGFMASWRDNAGELKSRGGVPGSQNSLMRTAALSVTTEKMARDANRRRMSDAALGHRRPGETVAEAVKREADENGERLRVARVAGGGVEPIDFSRMTHHPKARKFEPLPPKVWAELRRLAEERGEQPMALLPIVVEQGIAALRAA